MAKPNHDNGVVKSFIGESYEGDYWLEIFKETKIITEDRYEVMYNKCSKIRKLLISSITTAKKNQENSGI